MAIVDDWSEPQEESGPVIVDDWSQPAPEPPSPPTGDADQGIGLAPPSGSSGPVIVDDWSGEPPVAPEPAAPEVEPAPTGARASGWGNVNQPSAPPETPVVDDWSNDGFTGPDDGSLPSSPYVGFGEGGVGARARMAPEEYEAQEPRGLDRIGQAIEDTYNTGYENFAVRREDIRRSADRGDWLDVGRQVGEQVVENVPGRVARYSVDALAVTPEILNQGIGALADIGQDLANRPGPLGNRAFDAALAPAALARRFQQEGPQGVAERLGRAWQSDDARLGAQLRGAELFTGPIEKTVTNPDGSKSPTPQGVAVDAASFMMGAALDPTNYLGVGLGARIPGVVGKVVRGLDLAADAPFQAIARLAGNPKVGGTATMAGLGTLALDQFGQRFLDAQGKPILPSPSRWVAERVGPEYQGALSLLLPIGIGVGTAGLFRGANIGLSRASRTAIQAGGREIVKNVASGRAVLAQGYTQRADGAIVNSRTGKADPDVRLAQPGEFIDVPKRLDLPTRYSAGNLALNSYESTKAALLDQVKASPTAFGAGLRSMIDVVSQDESALRDGNRLAAAFNEGVSRTEAGRAGDIAVSPATFETVEGRQAAGLIVQTLREMAGIGPKERGNIADLIGNVMDRRGWTDDQMAVALDAMVINKVQRDLGIQNPTWASPVFRYLGLLDELTYNDAAKQALIAAGIDEAALTRGSRIAAEIANGAKGGASYRTARAEAQAQLQKIETAWKKIAPDAEGRVPRLPSALDPKLQGANINGWMDLMLASKAIFAPFQLIMRPAYTVANITSDAMAATWQTLKYGMLPSAKNIDLAKRLGLDVSHSYLTGKARGGLLGEAMFDRQPNEKLPARRGGARMFFDEIGYQMPGGRLLAKAVGLPGRLIGGAYEAATSIGPLNEVRRRQTLAATLAVAKHRQMVMDGYRAVYLGKGETPVRATELALREYNAILSGTKPEQWANGVDWNQVRTGWRTDAQAMASKLPPDQFAGAWANYVDERIAPVIRLMEALPQERAGALIRALDPASGAKDQIAAIRDSDAIWNAMVDDVLAVYAENAPFVWPPEGSFTIVPPELQRVSPEQALVPTPPRPGSPPPDFTIVPPDQQRVSPEQALVPIPPRQGPPPPPEMQTEPQRYPIDRRIAAYRREQMRPQPGQPGQPDWMMVPPEQRRVSPEQALVPAPRQPGQEPQQPAPPPTAARPARTARPAPAQAAPTPPPAPVQPVDVRQAYARQLAQAAKAAGISREVVVARLAIDDAFYEASLKPLGLTPEQFYGRMESRFDPTGQPGAGARTMAVSDDPPVVNLRYLTPDSRIITDARWRADGLETVSTVQNRPMGWAIYDKDGNRIAIGTDRLTRPTENALRHADSKAKAMAERWRDHEDMLQTEYFFRFGKLPPGGRSRNYATGSMEPGTSVYRAIIDPDTGKFKVVWTEGNIGAAIYTASEGRPIYLIEGKVIGRGSDGEPVLKNARIHREVAYDEFDFESLPIGQQSPSEFGSDLRFSAETRPDFRDRVILGWQEVSPEGRFVQTLTSKANRATVLHEGYHTYQRFMEEFPNEFAEPMRVLRETYGDDTELPARAFERYVSEGKAPTPALEGVFRQIAEWMASIYRKIVGSEIDVPLTNEVRQTFQQLLGGPAFRDDVRLRGNWEAATAQQSLWKDISAKLDAEQGRPPKTESAMPFVERAVFDRISRELGIDPKLIREEIGVDAGTTLANAYRAAQAKGDMATAQRLARALNMLGLVVDQYAVLPLPYPTVPRLKAGKGGPKGSPRVDEGLPRPVAVVRMADARRLQTVMETQGMAAYVKAAQAADVWQQIYNEARQERMPAAAAVREQLTARRDQLPETASPSAAPRTGDPTPHLQDRDPRFQADAVPDPDNVQRAANVTAPAVLNVEARRLALGEAIDRLPEPLKNNTALLADAIRRAENLPPNAKGRAISDVLNEQLGRTSMRDQARGRLTPAKLFSDETAIQIVEVADRYRAYLDAVDELNRLRGDALAEAGIDTRTVRDLADYRDVLDDIPDPYNPGWTLEDGTPYIGRGPDGEPVRTETGWQTPDGRPLRFTNGMGWVADQLSPSDAMRRLADEIKLQGANAVRSSNVSQAELPRLRLANAERREIDNAARIRASREALAETRARLFGYDDRSVGQNLVDHFAPYPYWTIQTIGNVAPYFARRPGQLFTLMSIFRDWAVANQNETESDTWTVFLWRAPDGTEVRIRPLNMLFPFGQAIGEVISPFGGEDRDWARVLRSMTSVFGASPYVPIEQGAQLATTLGAGGVTDWLTGERQENRARTLTTQGQLINRIIRATTGVDFDPMKGYRQAVYGDSTLGAERYFGGLELARRARDGEISIAQARQALLDAQEGRPSPIWDSAMRAAAGEQAKIRLMTYMGVPVDVNLAQAERGRQQNLDFFGEPGRLPRPDLRLTAERDRFVQENPDMSVRWMLNDDADKLRYGAAADDIRTRYDVAQRVLDERANRGEIDGRTWQAERKKLQAAEGAEWDALAQLPKGRNLTSGPPSAPFQADDAAALEAFRKVPYDEKNPGRQGEQRSALLAEIPERIREAVLAANYADETDVERYYRTVVQPVQNAYYAIPQYRGGTPEQQERWERAYDAFNDAFQASIARNNGSTAGASAFAFAELAKQGLSRQDYEQARANRSPERSAFLKTPEGAPLAQWWGQSATSQSTTGTGTTGAAPRPAGASVPSGSQARPTGGGGGATGGAANYRTFFTTDSEYRQLQGGTPVNKLEAKLLLAESWDSLVRSGWKPEGERPDPAKVRLEIERARIFETQPRDQGAAAYNTWLADGNAKRLNTLNGQLGIATRYPEYSREQLAIVDRYLALPSGRPRSEFLTANPQAKGAIDAYFAKQGWTGSSRLVTSPTPSSQTGPSRGSGGGGGGGGSRSVTPRQSPARPAQPHDDLPAFLREAADVAATLRSGQAINSTVLAALRRRFPFGVPLSARLDDWLAVVMSRLSQQQAA